jgi:Superfamily I DNA and RNA helicases and helicase subunits
MTHTQAPATPLLAALPTKSTIWPGAITQNTPASLLTSWTALEALSPQTYKSPEDLALGQRTIAPLDSTPPWTTGEKPKKKDHAFYYQVVLGNVQVDKATAALARTLDPDSEEDPQEGVKASIAVFMLDSRGVLLKEKSVAISSYAWALPKALEGDLAALGEWSAIEQGLIEALTTKLALTDQEGRRLPVSAATIKAAYDWLVATLGLSPEMIRAPSFAIRILHSEKAKNTPEVDLLNSFFLEDLARATTLVREGGAGTALARYLGIEKVEQSPDLLHDRPTLEGLIAPGKFPAARWPAPGGHPLVTLQQAAVNAVRAELGNGREGVVAVNGPPGTGKTTLLRDVVAACVLDRATALAKFDDPEAAFSSSGQKIPAGASAFYSLYKLHDSLRGHEVLVASSNNKAVENVSKELPSLKAIDGDLRYFKSVADRLLSKEKDGVLVPGEPTWGLIAAVLGNSTNRGIFQQAVWFDKERSFRLYLKAARGDDVSREVIGDDGETVLELPFVVAEEEPPTPEQARARWVEARQAFNTLKAEVDAELQALEAVRAQVQKIAPVQQAMAAAEKAHEAAQAAVIETGSAATQAKQALASAKAEADIARDLAQRARATRPGWLARLFLTQAYVRWREAYRPLDAAYRGRELTVAAASVEYLNLRERANRAEGGLQAAAKTMARCSAELSSLESSLRIHRERLGDDMVDAHFFLRGHNRWNLSAPWVPKALHAKREQLFGAALNLHRAFIDVAAKPVFHNLGAMMGAMRAGAFQDDKHRALLGDLWSTLFLIVPVLSTTFASVARMLGDLPPASLGWLLVDEAGQATPQSAVGAIMRAKRVIVVGDPLQIPPVVSLPKRLMVDVSQYFRVDANRWFAPEASVQAVSDAASRYEAEFSGDFGSRQVGMPLLVHRRCQEPMFGISNRIAYGGKMVHAAAKASADPIGAVLGPSAWWDVDGHAESKWCADEGEVVVDMLKRLAGAGVVSPNLYIITPFRVVAQGLKARLREEELLFARLGIDDPRDWITDRVGTIHTFQGKEADAVIAVLGAPKAAQQGARGWASGSPNILNVMVSRAKARLYVVGSRAAWGGMGNARDMAGRLPPAADQ